MASKEVTATRLSKMACVERFVTVHSKAEHFERSNDDTITVLTDNNVIAKDRPICWAIPVVLRAYA
jgi:hypothetical protein